MNTLVVYDSTHGNTATTADAIGAAIPGDVRVKSCRDVDAGALRDVDLLVVGSPTQGGRPTALLRDWIRRIPDGALRGVAVAAFDTRLPAAESGVGLRLLMGMIGYAAPRIARALSDKGGRLVAPEEGFLVEGREGPLKPGEVERARTWAGGLARSASAMRAPVPPARWPPPIGDR